MTKTTVFMALCSMGAAAADFPFRTLDLSDTPVKLEIRLESGNRDQVLALERTIGKVVTYTSTLRAGASNRATRSHSALEFTEHFNELGQFYESVMKRTPTQPATCKPRIAISVVEKNKTTFVGYLCGGSLDRRENQRFNTWFAALTK